MQQATVNLLSDMGAQPGTLQGGLVPGGPLDATAPTATITDPPSGATVPGGHRHGLRHGRGHRRRGRRGRGLHRRRRDLAAAQRARPTGRTRSARRRAGDRAGARRRRRGQHRHAGERDVRRSAPQACPCSIFTPSTTGVQEDDANAVELGVKFRSDIDGFITGIRFYKTAGNTGTHTGRLWTTAGRTWAPSRSRRVRRPAGRRRPSPRRSRSTPDTTYVASYHTTSGHYAAARRSRRAGVDNPPLHALQDGVDGAERRLPVRRRRRLSRPRPSASSNYLVDVVLRRGRRRRTRQRPRSSPRPGPERLRRRHRRERHGAVQRADGGGHDHRRDGRASRAGIGARAGGRDLRRRLLAPRPSTRATRWRRRPTYTATVKGGRRRRRRSGGQRAG